MPRHAFFCALIFYSNNDFEEKAFFTHSEVRRYLHEKDCIAYKIQNGKYIEIHSRNFNGVTHIELEK